MDFTRPAEEFEPQSMVVQVISCPECDSTLELHQPDPELADRLLATCDECKAWFLTNPRTKSLIKVVHD